MKILFVCTGNICRSPSAEAVARRWLEECGLATVVEVDSAGTHGYHIGEAPDLRTQRAAERRGYDLSRLRARKVVLQDFTEFDFIMAMDRSHYETLTAMAPPGMEGKVRLFMNFARSHGEDEVPDPYYGGERGFDAVLDMCEDAIGGMIESLFRAGGR